MSSTDDRRFDIIWRRGVSQTNHVFGVCGVPDGRWLIAIRLACQGADGEEILSLDVNASTWQPLAVSLAGDAGEVTYSFDDWREIGTGLVLPFRTELSRGDQVWTTHFGNTLPVNLTHDKARDRYLLLTDDRHFHQIDLTSGKLTHVGTLPLTQESKPCPSVHSNHTAWMFANHSIPTYTRSTNMLSNPLCLGS